MSKALFQDLLATGTILLDGATGTELQSAGMPAGVLPEMWLLENKAVLASLQTAYMQAGAQIIYTFTFGANRIKLASRTSDAREIKQINQQLAAISLKARADFCQLHPERKILVAGDLAPTGLFLQPAGELGFDQLVGIYKEQVAGLLAAGVDLFVVETMLDLAQARAAVLAVKESCDLPVMVSMTLEEGGRTMSGNTPLACLLALAALGVDAFGLNCSFGPDRLAEHIQPLQEYSPVPLFIKPNAGMPQLIDNKTVFNMDAASFASSLKPHLADGLDLVGGCCGTGPAHIKALAGFLEKQPRPGQRKRLSGLPDLLCSGRDCLAIENVSNLPRIQVQDPEDLLDDVLDALDNEPPALVLDFTAWPVGQDADLAGLLQELQLLAPLPLIFSTSRSALLELLLRNYHGRAGLTGSPAPATYAALHF